MSGRTRQFLMAEYTYDTEVICDSDCGGHLSRHVSLYRLS